MSNATTGTASVSVRSKSKLRRRAGAGSGAVPKPSRWAAFRSISMKPGIFWPPRCDFAEREGGDRVSVISRPAL